MTFLNPLLLFGISAIAAPILIHLLMNRRIKPMAWAAMRFLRVCVQKNKKRMNVEDLLLLALRCLILILLALALARPMFGRAGSDGAAKGGQMAVIALDNSYSMGQSDSNASRFDQARAAAEQIIDSLPGGSSVAVFLFSDVVRAAIPEPTYDLNLARKVIRDAAISNRGTDVRTVLKEAQQTLGRHASASQRVYLITDGQASGWKPFGETSAMLQNEAVKTSIILVGNPEDHILCVSDVRPAGTMAATVGEANQFDVEVTNFSASEAKDTSVRLAIDDEKPCDEGVIASIPPGGSKRIALFAKFHEAGFHSVTGQINPDHIPGDEQRTIAVRATDDVRILLVDGEPSPASGQSAAFYLRNAFAPVPLKERDRYAVKTKAISPVELDSTKLADFEAVVLANVSDLSPSATEAMAAYLKRGGGLIIFPGSKTTASFYNDTLGKKFGFLPAALGALRGKPEQTDTFATLQSQDYANPIVSLWNDPAEGTLASAHFYRNFELKPDSGRTMQAGEAQVVVKYSDGSPAVMERAWGRGRVILFSSSANTEWNDLALHPVYLPLMDRTLGAILNHQDARLNVPVGSPLEFVCEPDWVNKDAIVVPPGDKKAGGSVRHIEMQDGVPLLRFEETDKSGAYDVTIKSDPPATVKFAAQSNAAESNLEGLNPAQLTALGTAAQVTHWTPATHLEDQISKQHGGPELWIVLTALVIVATCVELVLAGKFSASK